VPRLWTGALACLLATTTLVLAQDGASLPPLPPRLERYVTSTAALTGDERRQLLQGAPVAKLLGAEESEETAVFGAVWIAAPMSRYVDIVENIERFERGGAFKVTRRISTPPRLEDFAELRLPDEDVAALPECRIGACKLKLDEQALRRFQSEIDWNEPNARAAADALMQQIALEYVTAYLEGGNERLPVYRDHEQPIIVARELRAITDDLPDVTAQIPDLRRYLLGYPRVRLPDTTSFLYWQEAEFGLKPTIRISHLIILEGPDDTVIASKMLYATHYFRAGLELRVLVPDPARGAGFWFVTINRSKSDGLTGMRGLFVGPRVRNEVQEGSLAVLQRTKRMLEPAR
jgi:hypothetical protein